MYTYDYRKQSYLDVHMMRHGLIDNYFRNTMLLWLSDTLVTAAHTGDYSPSC